MVKSTIPTCTINSPVLDTSCQWFPAILLVFLSPCGRRRHPALLWNRATSMRRAVVKKCSMGNGMVPLVELNHNRLFAALGDAVAYGFLVS